MRSRSSRSRRTRSYHQPPPAPAAAAAAAAASPPGPRSTRLKRANPLTRQVNLKQCKTKLEGCNSFIKEGRQYDADGDGLPDTPAEIAGMYFAWAPAFIAMMRRALGEDAVILANSAGSLSDPSLSGVTIEMEGCVGSRGGAVKCANALSGQHAATTAAGRAPLSVLWLTHSEAMSAAQQCAAVAALQQEYPYVQAGTDFFDGSHIVCGGE